MNDESIGDANHDEAAKAFKQAGNHVQLLVRYDPVEFNRFQVHTYSTCVRVVHVCIYLSMLLVLFRHFFIHCPDYARKSV